VAETLVISVVVPAHNAALFLAAAVASVREQEPAVAEIIVVDDGSTDATAAVASGLGVTLIHQANQGPAAARNAGVAAATGTWIAFLDADDTWVEGKLARQLAVVAAHPEVVLVAGDMAEVDREGNVVCASVMAAHGHLDRFRALGGAPIPRAAGELLEANFIPTPTVLVRRAVVLAVGGFDPALAYGEDLELWARIATRFPIAVVPEVLMRRTRHAANLTGGGLETLRGLVRVGEAIRRWPPGALAGQGVGPDGWAAARYLDLGHALSLAGATREARWALRQSLCLAPSWSAARALLLATLPGALARRLRGGWGGADEGVMVGRRRILYVENGIGPGGALVCLRHLVRHLDRNRYDPLVVTGRRGGVYEELARDAPWRPIRDRWVEVAGLKGRLATAAWPDRLAGLRWLCGQLLARLDDLANFLPFFLGLLATAVRFRPHLIHANNEPLCNRAALLVGRLLGVKVVCHVRGQRDAGGSLSLFYRLPHHLLAVSHWVAGEIVGLGIPAERVEVVYDGIELERMDPAADGMAWRRVHDLPEDGFVVGLVGLLIPWKGQQLLLDAAPRLFVALPDLHLVFAGGTPAECAGYEAELRDRVRREGLEERVHFLGHVAEMAALYNGLDVVLSCSTAPEPLGTMVIEAMAMGRPLIGPAYGGAAEMIVAGESGLLFPPGDVAALVAAIVRLHADPREAARLGAAARARALALFAVEEHVRRVTAAYDRLLPAVALAQVAGEGGHA